MHTDDTVQFLGKLLNRQVSGGERLKLSSAQRARFVGWLEQRGLRGLEAELQREFTVDSLLPAAAGPKAPSVAQGESVTDASGITVPLDVGIDIQSVAELGRGVDPLDLKSSAELCAVFTGRELSYAETRPNPLETLTGLYAAKEAIWKSSGAGDLPSRDFRELEILPDETGRPRVRGFAVSISHSGGVAVAVACRAESHRSRADHGAAPPPRRQDPPQRERAERPFGRYGLFIAALLGLLVLLQGAVLAELALFRH